MRAVEGSALVALGADDYPCQGERAAGCRTTITKAVARLRKASGVSFIPHAAATSTKTNDMLMPTIDVCRKCHNATAAGVRSDCLECHTYHPRDHGSFGK